MSKQAVVDQVNSLPWSHAALLAYSKAGLLTCVPQDNGTWRLMVDVDKVPDDEYVAWEKV